MMVMLTQESEGIAVTSEKENCQQCRPVRIRKSKKCVMAEIMCWRKSGRRRKSGGVVNWAFGGKENQATGENQVMVINRHLVESR